MTEKSKQGGQASTGIRFTIVALAALLLLATAVYRWHASRLGPPSTIYTPKQLSKFTGRRGGRVLVAVLGSVFDVTSGRQHYGPGGAYSVFAGRDATRSFVTGKFDQDLDDNIADFTPEQFAEVVRWREFYTTHASYRFVGRVTGRFYDTDGDQTPLLIRAELQAELHRKEEERKKGKQSGKDEGAPKEVQCDFSWSKANGKWVHCAEGMYPRRVLADDDGEGAPSKAERCVCSPSKKVSGRERLFDGCSADAKNCRDIKS